VKNKFIVIKHYHPVLWITNQYRVGHDTGNRWLVILRGLHDPLDSQAGAVMGGKIYNHSLTQDAMFKVQCNKGDLFETAPERFRVSYPLKVENGIIRSTF
jgi:hypothetical protein